MTLVNLYREQNLKMTYFYVVQYERAEGEAVRARNRNSSMGRRSQAEIMTIENCNRERKPTALMMESNNGSQVT